MRTNYARADRSRRDVEGFSKPHRFTLRRLVSDTEPEEQGSRMGLT